MGRIFDPQDVARVFCPLCNGEGRLTDFRDQ